MLTAMSSYSVNPPISAFCLAWVAHEAIHAGYRNGGERDRAGCGFLLAAGGNVFFLPARERGLSHLARQRGLSVFVIGLVALLLSAGYVASQAPCRIRSFTMNSATCSRETHLQRGA